MRRVGLLLISIALTLAVFGFSTQSGESSGSLSLQVAEFLANVMHSILPSVNVDVTVLHTVLRKTAHVVEYAVLGISYALTLLSFKKSLWMALPIGLFIALLDEGLQLLSIDRGPSIMDALLFDFPGIILGTFFVALITLQSRKNNVS